MLDLRRSMMRPAARVVPLWLGPYARKAQTSFRARGLTSDDVIAGSYPKSGSTWLRFMVADLVEQEDTANFGKIREMSPPLGRHRDGLKVIDGRGRFIKTHASFSAFTSFSSRGLYIVRDGRDVAISLFHYLRRLDVYSGPFDEYLTAFLAGRVVTYGSWQEHVTAWLTAAAERPEAIAVVRYEDLLSPEGPEKLRDSLGRIGWTVTLEAATAAVQRNSFDAMKQKETERMKKREAEAQASGAFVDLKGRSTPSTPFVRAGKAEQWRKEFSEEQLRRFRDVAGPALQLAGYEG